MRMRMCARVPVRVHIMVRPALVTRAVCARVALVPRDGRGDGDARLLHAHEPLAREVALVHALRHAQVVGKCEEVEGVAKGYCPLKDS